MITRQQRREVDGRGAVHGPQYEIAGRLPALDRSLGFIVQGKQAGCVIEQDFAGRRQLQALTFAQEQIDT
ncbi:hypothetical protein D9M73_245990 [compost metagenome]